MLGLFHKVPYTVTASIRFWRQYEPLFTSIAAIVFLLLTSDRKSSRWRENMSKERIISNYLLNSYKIHWFKQ